MTAAELWAVLRAAHPDLPLDKIEAELSSPGAFDQGQRIEQDPTMLLVRIRERAISNGIGAGRGGGPAMQAMSEGCYTLLEAGLHIMDAGSGGRKPDGP